MTTTHDNFSTWMSFFVVFGLLGVWLFMLAAGGGPSDADAQGAVRAFGFSDPVVKERTIWSSLAGCGRGDSVAFDMRATNPAGQRVAVLVCCGAVMKSCTVRVK